MDRTGRRTSLGNGTRRDPPSHILVVDCSQMLIFLNEREFRDWWVRCGKEAWLQEQFRLKNNTSLILWYIT
ncbi:hypothetical protein TNCV_2424671 [Trichonephila clavipes]|nr:hypothetical protein TNCV_2424671 [Trichonephila clavipes]